MQEFQFRLVHFRHAAKSTDVSPEDTFDAMQRHYDVENTASHVVN